MRKRITQYGNTAVIVLTKQDLDLYGWKIGDILDIEANKLETIEEQQ